MTRPELYLLISSVLIFSLCGSEKREVNVREEKIDLPRPVTRGSLSLEEVLQQRKSVRSFTSGALSLPQLSQLLWAAQGTTHERSLFRTAPSAGALFPLSVRCVAERVDGLAPGLYRYGISDHSLERMTANVRVRDVQQAALGQSSLGEAALVIIISGDYSITAYKYGTRAQRYVHMEAGHAAQNILLQVVSLGLGAVPVGAFEDDSIRSVLDLPPGETPFYLIPVGRAAE